MKNIHILVEGPTDAALAIRIITAAGHSSGTVYGKKGCGFIKMKIDGFNRAASGAIYLALIDFMDTGSDCPPQVVSAWLPHRNPNMLFRVVVRELESWLLADRQGISGFLNVSLDKVPIEPEKIDNPKRTLVDLARGSRSRKIKEALVPETGSTAQVGKLYVSEMVRFINTEWDKDKARLNAPSLDRCLTVLESLK